MGSSADVRKGHTRLGYKKSALHADTDVVAIALCHKTEPGVGFLWGHWMSIMEVPGRDWGRSEMGPLWVPNAADVACMCT